MSEVAKKWYVLRAAGGKCPVASPFSTCRAITGAALR
jgi:hypothetical protein